GGRNAEQDLRRRGHDRRQRRGLGAVDRRAQARPGRRRGQGVHDRLRRRRRRARAGPDRGGRARTVPQGEPGQHRVGVRGDGRIPVTADDPRKPKFRKVFAKAASTWTSLGVARAAALAAAALGSWPILAIGGAAYAALVGWDLSNPEFWKKALGNRAEPVALPDP